MASPSPIRLNYQLTAFCRARSGRQDAPNLGSHNCKTNRSCFREPLLERSSKGFIPLSSTVRRRNIAEQIDHLYLAREPRRESGGQLTMQQGYRESPIEGTFEPIRPSAP